MKIAILNSCLFPIPAVKGGAVETLIESLIKGANQDSSLEITLFSLHDPKAQVKSQSLYPNIKIKWLKRSKLVDFIDQHLTTLFRLIKQNKAIWQKNFVWQPLVKKLLAADLLKEAYDAVLIENSLYLADIFSQSKLKEKYTNKVFFHSHNLQSITPSNQEIFAGVISISHFLVHNLKEKFDSHVPIKVIHNRVDVQNFKTTPSHTHIKALKKQHSIPEDCPLILFVGRIMPQKGVLELIQAFEKIRNQHAHLLIVGSSSFGMQNKTAFEKEIDTLILQNPRIHKTGFVSNQKLATYYTSADLIVLPSTWPEPLGLTMIEAQLSGTPLITTNQGGIPETTSADTSILLEVTDSFTDTLSHSIDLVLNHQDDWNAKAKLAQNTAFERFDDTTYAQHIFQFIRETLADN